MIDVTKTEILLAKVIGVEHSARTGHDNFDDLLSPHKIADCSACLYLREFWEEVERAGYRIPPAAPVKGA